jgi:hypothetical protein
MITPPQVALDRGKRVACGHVASWLVFGLLVPGIAHAQFPSGVAGRIVGDDISVQNAAGVVPPESSRSIYLANGSKITVHAGQARMELTGGAEIGVCGPAALTLLESEGAFTLAISFGRVHLRLGPSTPISVFTPLIVATPVGIVESPREATLGLDVSGALCVRATRGAVRLQQQLTGETIVIPQPTEVFLPPGELHATPGVTGVCQCEIPPAPPVSSEPTAIVPKPSILPPPIPTPPKQDSASAAANSGASKPATNVATEVSVPAHASEVPPVEKKPEPRRPATQVPVWKVMMPPLAFDFSKPAPPPDPSPATILLVREVRVETDWVFRGRVEPRAAPVPAHEAAVARRRRSKPKPVMAHPSSKPVGARPKSGGILGFFKRLFGSGSS